MRTRILVALVLAAGLAAGFTPAHAKPTTGGPTKTAKWSPVVPFIEDDFGRALALAKERKLPVFIEGWAPW
jgi:hypothetical protein